VKEYKYIWLQPECCADPDEGRHWCQDPDPVDCDDGEPWTKYILVSEHESLERQLADAHSQLQQAREERDSYKYAMEQLTNQVSVARQSKEAAIVNAAVKVKLLDMGTYFEASPYHAVERLRMSVDLFLRQPLPAAGDGGEK
jgi:hypothetical protein